MFKQPKYIDSALRYIRSFTLCVITGCLLITAFSLYRCFHLLSSMSDRIYVLAGGAALPARRMDRKDQWLIEARDHIKTFHRLFFSLDPDDAVIRRHIAEALYLADASAKEAYDNLREQGYYARVVAGNISQRIRVDSIRLDITHTPALFTCYATERIIRATRTVTRSLVTAGRLREVSRSDHNPHGLLIEKWHVLTNPNRAP
jgi:conjugative transposon TraK protein